MKILVINCGSSSLKYQLFLMPEGLNLIKGIVEKIGAADSFLKQETKEGKKLEIKKPITDHTEAFKAVVDAILDNEYGVLHNINEIDAVGHRVVHGGEKYNESAIITDDVIKDIEMLSDLAPLHNPANLQGIKAAMEVFSSKKADGKEVKHSATFDTAFHQTIPDYAYMYALPYELYEKYKIRRYGFHGTSHRYVANKALELCKRAKENTNLITVHLGNGCSITAIHNGKSIDTSMGLTPLEGLVMGTRSGDIDPAIIHYLIEKGLTDKEIIEMLNKKSGLLGLSEVSNDLRDLEKAALEGNKKAQIAIDTFAYRVKKYIGAFCAVMVKLDIIVFTGGIGQNSYLMRERISKCLENVGIHLDKERNKLVGNHTGMISTDYSPVTMLVIPTDEEEQMARDAYSLLMK
ncbi:MAG: acetate kinase [Spirochaetes bacterium GWD1_27_9]|nr:MAG: acetate kinase [Spirochaetes bacterium GWB1_27_13]OHD27238.1 MAG: acetate kinase [Spirochaetes bacterium GWC1_27_15]OHD39597.1 MAG: acetate kinase [Spirochaetes bacterium GWD1_27_9]